MATAPKAGVTHARPKAKDEKGEKGKAKAPTFPSAFGSHTSMINAELNEKVVTAKQDASDPWQILTDERGNYATRKHRLDTGMADPSRFADQDVREKLVKELTA
jgi:thioredoxin reductase